MSSKRGGNIFRTVTFRIVLWYAALFIVSSFGVFLFIYFTLASSLHHRMDDNLLVDAQEFTSIYNAGGVEGLRSEFEIEAKSEGTERVFLRLMSPELAVLASSDTTRWGGLDAHPDGALRPPDDRPVFRTLTLPNHSEGVRFIFKKTSDGNIIQMGQTLREDQRLMARYRENFGAAIAVMAVLGIVVAWILARHAMKGVERVTQTAVRISEGDLTLRVPLGSEGEEIDKLAIAFNNMLERIQLLVAELKDMTNNIAHDLRSPITRIRGVAETTLTGEQRIDEYQEMAVAVVEESDRLVGMINTMLELAHTESGIADFSIEPVDLGKVVRDAYELFQPVAEDEGIRFEIDLPQEALIVSGDVTRLQRVLANLLDNAIKYTEAGGRVRLEAKRNKSDVTVSVIDSGIGISGADLPHIFERFYRHDRSRSTPGSGLGLTLALAFARAHGGDITATSAPGEGATFTVTLPRRAVPS